MYVPGNRHTLFSFFPAGVISPMLHPHHQWMVKCFHLRLQCQDTRSHTTSLIIIIIIIIASATDGRCYSIVIYFSFFVLRDKLNTISKEVINSISGSILIFFMQLFLLSKDKCNLVRNDYTKYPAYSTCCIIKCLICRREIRLDRVPHKRSRLVSKGND
jgi:hypothetical protein